jgi:8-oxo-dGTP diphosphatase
MNFVAGFAVCMQPVPRVALIRKSHPAWQAGKLNGVGGKIEIDAGETPMTAMVREFQEETGRRLVGWREAVKLTGTDYRVHFFVAFTELATLAALRGSDDEPIEVLNVKSALAHTDLIPNLRWIIPLCLDPSNVYAEAYE